MTFSYWVDHLIIFVSVQYIYIKNKKTFQNAVLGMNMVWSLSYWKF